MGGKTLITPIGIRIPNKEKAELKKLAATLGIPFNTAVVEAIRLYLEHQEIQEKYGVSGLADKTVELGYSTITIKEPHDSLALISSDHKILAEQRFEIGEVFVRALHSNGMKLYQRIDEPRDGWAEVKNSDAALAAIAGCDWATIWSNSYFINRKELRSKGLTHRNSLPLSSDHEQEWEIHLSCGTGEYTESIDDDNIRYWFCAYRGTTGLAL